MSAVGGSFTTVTGPMLDAARRTRAPIYARRSTCGRWVIFQPHTQPPPSWGRWVLVADADDVEAYALAHGTDTWAAGAALTRAILAQGVL